MSLLKVLNIIGIIITVVALIIPEKYRSVSIGLLIIALCIVASGIIVEVLL